MNPAIERGDDYLMIKNAEIRNFRCFERVDLDKCRRLNVIVGRNAAGKTAILEALFLTVAPSPEVVNRLRLWRGYEMNMAGSFDDVDEAFWSDLFYRYDLGRKISIRVRGSGDYTRALQVTYGTREVFVPINKQDAAASSAVTFSWAQGKKKPNVVRPRFTGAGYQFPGVERSPIHARFFAASHPFNNPESVKGFSALDLSRRSDTFVASISREFPFIRGIDIQTHAGASMLHADIPWLPKKVPLASVSAGVHKLAVMLLAVAERNGSAIFVDEIENGFHYSRYESVWRTLLSLCEQHEVQLFASTHSEECLRALANVSKEKPDAVSLIRSEMDDNGNATVSQFVGLKSAQFGELR